MSRHYLPEEPTVWLLSLLIGFSCFWIFVSSIFHSTVSLKFFHLVAWSHSQFLWVCDYTIVDCATLCLSIFLLIVVWIVSSSELLDQSCYEQVFGWAVGTFFLHWCTQELNCWVLGWEYVQLQPTLPDIFTKWLYQNLLPPVMHESSSYSASFCNWWCWSFNYTHSGGCVVVYVHMYVF